MAPNKETLEQQVAASLPAIIQKGDAKVLVTQAQALGHALGERRGDLELTTTQLRAIFGTVRQIEMNWQSDEDREQAQRKLIMLKPKMVYRANRESGSKQAGMKAVSNIFGQAIDIVVDSPKEKSRQYFNHFVEFFEATLAYHREAGGK